MNVVDLAALALLGVSVVLGVFRGLIAQVLSLLGWGVAYFASQWLAPRGMTLIPLEALGPGAKMAVVMVLVFVAALLAWGLLSMALVKAVRATGMSGPDRALGAVFGLFKGLLVAAAIVTLVQMTPLRSTDTWRQAQSVNWMRAALRGLSPMLPEAVAREVAWGG